MNEQAEAPHHEHVTVDEETYWGLMYLHIELRTLIKEGKVTDPVLLHYSADAERRLEQSRRWNAADPSHAARASTARGGMIGTMTDPYHAGDYPSATE
jgi:hypothetical protein